MAEKLGEEDHELRVITRCIFAKALENLKMLKRRYGVEEVCVDDIRVELFQRGTIFQHIQ